MKSLLKVCGLTQLDQITELINIQVDYLGFIFYEKSPRYVLNSLSLKQISQINHPGKVGVFVNKTIDEIIEITAKAQLNIIQLHGDEDQFFILELKKKLDEAIKIIKVVRIANQSKEQLQDIVNEQATFLHYLLFDTDSKAFGGTGTTFDWSLLNDIKIPIPYFLSGGISTENLQHLSSIQQQPFALDINSRFEIAPGNKDLEKIKTFKNIIKNEL